MQDTCPIGYQGKHDIRPWQTKTAFELAEGSSELYLLKEYAYANCTKCGYTIKQEVVKVSADAENGVY